ncbi:unnamed protein product, partial [Meganyctiphanes norvegica]
MAGQSINDRLTAARYSLAGQGLAKSVCKATTEEVIGPKKKHLDYLLHCTNEPNVSIPQLANLLIERTQMQSWVIVFKALITVHHMMCYGNERFTQYLASSNCNFNLGGFLDKTGVAGYDMSTFIRRYAKYINEKAVAYRTVAFDFCKVKRGKDDGTLRTMPTETLLKTLPVLQTQLDALLDFDCTANELTNGVINSSFMLLFRDLIRLFACYNDGIINLLEKYFEMNKKQNRSISNHPEHLLLYIEFHNKITQMTTAVGMDKSEIPDLKQAPSSLLDALEAHLASLEGKKPPIPGSTTPASKVNIGDAVSALNSTSISFGSVSSNGRMGETGTATNGTAGAAAADIQPMDEVAKRAALAEEEAMYEKLRTEHSKNNPFLSSPTTEALPSVPTTSNNGESSQILDLFGATDTEGATQNAQRSVMDEIILLGCQIYKLLKWHHSGADFVIPSDAEMNGIVCFSHPSAGSGFVTSNAFDAVFGNSSTAQQTKFNGSIQEPTHRKYSLNKNATNIEVSPFRARSIVSSLPKGFLDVQWTLCDSHVKSVNLRGEIKPITVVGCCDVYARVAIVLSYLSKAFDGFGDILKPEGSLGGGDSGSLLVGSQVAAPTTTVAPTNTQASGKLISGDLDMSLSSLVDNLNIKGAPTQKPGQWNSPKAQGKTGGAGWTPAAPTAAIGGIRPGMPATGAMQPQPGFPGGFPQQQQQQQQMGMGIVPGGMGMQQPSGAIPQQPTQTTATPFDPFGGL